MRLLEAIGVVVVIAGVALFQNEIDAQHTRERAVANHCAGYDHDTGKWKWEPIAIPNLSEALPYSDGIKLPRVRGRSTVHPS